MKTTILFPFRRISISFFASVALLGFHTLCAEVATVQTDAKTTSASPVERVAQASTRAHFGTQPLRRMGDWADDPNEAAQLQSIFDSTRNAYASIAPGPDEGAKRKAVSMELTRELESFLQQHPSSGWAADLHLQLALACQLRSSYSKAIEYYSLAWEATKDFEQNPARQIALEAAGPLARLLAVTGRNAQLETLRAEAQAAGRILRGAGSGSLWTSVVDGGGVGGGCQRLSDSCAVGVGKSNYAAKASSAGYGQCSKLSRPVPHTDTVLSWRSRFVPVSRSKLPRLHAWSRS